MPSSCSSFLPQPGWCPSSSCLMQSGGCWQEELLHGNGKGFCVAAGRARVGVEEAEMVQVTLQAGRARPWGAGQGGGTREKLFQPLGEGEQSQGRAGAVPSGGRCESWALGTRHPKLGTSSAARGDGQSQLQGRSGERIFPKIQIIRSRTRPQAGVTVAQTSSAHPEVPTPSEFPH